MPPLKTIIKNSGRSVARKKKQKKKKEGYDTGSSENASSNGPLLLQLDCARRKMDRVLTPIFFFLHLTVFGRVFFRIILFQAWEIMSPSDESQLRARYITRTAMLMLTLRHPLLRLVSYMRLAFPRSVHWV